MSSNEPLHIFGEVLFDHFPDGSRVLGGAPFNVAWHLQAFGQSPRFISRIGIDPAGFEIAELMDAWGMSREALQVDSEHPTGSVRVLIQNDEPHYEIVADSAFDFIEGELLEKKNTQGILYHGSLAVRNTVARAALQVIKVRHQGKIFVDVNLRPPWWGPSALLPLLDDADWVKLNEDELAVLCPESDGLEAAMLGFCELFDLDTLIVTRGEESAVACDSSRNFVALTSPESSAVIDTVGADDAFAAILLLGLSQQWPLKTTLERAQSFACAVVGRRGATLADIEFYHSFSEQWD